MPDAKPCEFCGESRAWPCMNSLDVEASAEDGDAVCLGVLKRDKVLGDVGYDRIVERIDAATREAAE